MNAYDDWTTAASGNPLTLTSGGYTLTIDQTATSPKTCAFDSPVAGALPTGATTLYTPILINLQGKDMQLGQTDITPQNGKRTFLVCEKRGSDYQMPTTFGQITLTAPADIQSVIVEQARQMIGSLKKL